jgi:hypothetical protein
MTWLVLYLGIGWGALSVIFIAHQMTQSDGTELYEKLLDAADPERKTWHRRLIDRVLIPAAAAGMIVVAWPIAIVWKIKDLVAERREAEPVEEKRFEVEQIDLVERYTVPEAELCESVYDPLQAAPNLAFGHLNRAWELFKSNMQPGSEIWSFSTRWTTPSGRQEHRKGYAIVSDTGIGTYLLTSRRINEDE